MIKSLEDARTFTDKCMGDGRYVATQLLAYIEHLEDRLYHDDARAAMNGMLASDDQSNSPWFLGQNIPMLCKHSHEIADAMRSERNRRVNQEQAK